MCVGKEVACGRDMYHIREYSKDEIYKLFECAFKRVNVEGIWLGLPLIKSAKGLTRFPKKLQKYSQYWLAKGSK